MRIRTQSRATYLRASFVASGVLVAAATQASVTASSRTGAAAPVQQTGQDSAFAQSSSGEARATSAPALSAKTEKKGDNLPFINGSNATFNNRARIINGGGKSARVSFGATGMVLCTSDPGGLNPSGGSVRGGIIGGSTATCSVSCSNGIPASFSGCGGAALQGRIKGIKIRAGENFTALPDEIRELIPDFKQNVGIGDIPAFPGLAASIAAAIKLSGFPKFNLPKGAEVKVGLDVEYFLQLPFSTIVSGSGSLVVASVLANANAMQSSMGKAEVNGSGSGGNSLLPGFVALAGLGSLAPATPGFSVLAVTTKGPVPPGMKLVFDGTSTEIEVREETPCSDGVDNDGDGFTDFPSDRGCETPFSASENPAVAPVDTDLDLIFDGADNCPTVFNPFQEDVRGVPSPTNPDGSLPDGVGDACQ